ncbi:MAG: hypothetical protein AAB427_03840 [Chloroflexota bacterium]
MQKIFDGGRREDILKFVSITIFLTLVAACSCALLYLLISQTETIQQINQGIYLNI